MHPARRRAVGCPCASTCRHAGRAIRSCWLVWPRCSLALNGSSAVKDLDSLRICYMHAEMHSEPYRRSCGAPRTTPYPGERHVRFSRCVVAHLGRFLPRLGPFVSRAAPSLCCDPSDVAPTWRPPLHSHVLPDFCNAKGFACILCAAHLNRGCEAGDFVAGFAALLGRFLPRLGPHGPPRGPFYFLAQDRFGWNHLALTATWRPKRESCSTSRV